MLWAQTFLTSATKATPGLAAPLVLPICNDDSGNDYEDLMEHSEVDTEEQQLMSVDVGDGSIGDLPPLEESRLQERVHQVGP